MQNFNSDKKYKKTRRGGFKKPSGDKRDSGNVTMHYATCSKCGNDCQVPFKPTGGKPVFCSNCFEREGNQGNNRSNNRFAPKRDINGGGKTEKSISRLAESIDKLNEKLDSIIELLSKKDTDNFTKI